TRRGFAAMAGGAAVALTGQRLATAQQQAGGQGSGPGMGMMTTASGITVTGNGRATAEVEAGILQFLVRYSQDSPVLSGAMSEGMYGMDTPAPDEDALTNVVNALIDAGVPEDQIATSIGSGS